ncbi:hypothetical protein [Burkholderia ubonensis]|uniref:hypothetical protein n=1 Tax=Burkholderia ubonensis TaxID=101571 RepID=UPI002ABD9628|nr:hypothetical protein [Burkholderia ubonensis]
MIDQAAMSFQQAAASLDVLRTSTARAAATFIADKRQKWIDDLRGDVSLYVTLTQEIVAGWKRIFSRLGNRWDEVGPPRAPRELEAYSEDVRKFAEGIAEHDSLHAQALTRIMLRLNGDEHAHRELTDSLYNVRAALGAICRYPAAANACAANFRFFGRSERNGNFNSPPIDKRVRFMANHLPV